MLSLFRKMRIFKPSLESRGHLLFTLYQEPSLLNILFFWLRAAGTAIFPKIIPSFVFNRSTISPLLTRSNSPTLASSTGMPF